MKMDYYLIAGMVAVCLIAFYGFNQSLKKSYKEDFKQFEKLNENIIKLNLNFEHMLELDKSRDEKIKDTRTEMFNIKDQVKENEHILANHETRILSLEGKRGN